MLWKDNKDWVTEKQKIKTKAIIEISVGKTTVKIWVNNSK